MKRVLLVVHSDIGRGNTIGFRFGLIAHALEKRGISCDIIARANYDHTLSVTTPWYRNVVVRFFNALRIYLFPRCDLVPYAVKVFDRFVVHQLRRMSGYTTVHFGEFLPRSIAYAKSQGARVYLDVPMGDGTYVESLPGDIRIGKARSETPAHMAQAIAAADILLLPSLFVKKTLDYAGFSEKKYVVVPFGSPSVELKEKKNSTDKVTFLFVGSVNQRKGVEYLLEAWEKADLKDANLIFCGRVYAEIKPIIRKFQKCPNISFAGFVDPKPYYMQADVFVFPTLLEGSAKAVYEALAYGLPVITTEHAGSVVEDGISGCIVPVADPDILAKKILLLYNDVNKRKDMSVAARKRAMEFPWERYADSVLDVYV